MAAKKRRKRRNPAMAFLIITCLVLVITIGVLLALLLGNGGKSAPADLPENSAPAEPTAEPIKTEADLLAEEAAAKQKAEEDKQTMRSTVSPSEWVNTEILGQKPTENQWLMPPQEVLVASQEALNIRSSPNTKGAQIGSIPAGSSTIAVAHAMNWFLIEYAPDQFGWASGKYVIGTWMFGQSYNGNIVNLEAPDALYASPLISTITVDGANIRSGSSTAYSAYKQLSFGEEVTVLGEKGEWYLINSTGTFAWIHRSNIAEISKSSMEDGTYLYCFDTKASVMETEAGLLWMRATKATTAADVSEVKDKIPLCFSGGQYFYRDSDTMTLAFEEKATITDRCYAAELLSSGAALTDREKEIYGIVAGEDGSAIATFTAEYLDSYLSLCRSNIPTYNGFVGEVTLSGRLVTYMSNIARD